MNRHPHVSYTVSSKRTVLTALLALMLLCLFLSPALPAGAEDSSLNQIIQKKEIRVGTSGDYQPFSYFNPKTNQYEGMDISLAQKLGEALGTKGFMIRQGDQIFLNWLNLWLDQMFLEGEIQKLQQRWLGTVMK